MSECKNETYTQRCTNCGHESNELAMCPKCCKGVMIGKKPGKWQPYRASAKKRRMR